MMRNVEDNPGGAPDQPLLPPEHDDSKRYVYLKRNMLISMIVVTVIPLILMAFINHYQYQKAIQEEVVQPIRGMINKTKHSFELFITERFSAVKFIASSYSYNELSDQEKLNKIFEIMRAEFGGFVDLGLINSDGVQVSYVGPYELQGKRYTEQAWFQEVRVRGTYVSDVFLGYRKFPHLVMAVYQGMELPGTFWILRATIDTAKFDQLIASMGMGPSGDAFILNRSGVFQTSSKFYGDVLETFPMELPPTSYEPTVIETTDPQGKEILMGYSYFVSPAYVLVVIKPRTETLKSWYSLKGDILLFLAASIILIIAVIFRVTGVMVRRMQESDQKRKVLFHEMQYTNKLASIGRLAAGVAHEINNPLAIINEKAGLMKDLIEFTPDLPQGEKLNSLAASIIGSVDRCRAITHRLLGFARRMDVAVEIMDLNAVIKEVLGFLEKEALHRNINLVLELDDSLPKIASDQGQLQQVFLNIINNAFSAVENGGTVNITSWEPDIDMVAVSIRDNGMGMSEKTKKHIFEPFFTTKKSYGTGLGLSITYGIVKRLGGSIEVQSKEGQGTKFTVFLPKKAREGMER